MYVPFSLLVFRYRSMHFRRIIRLRLTLTMERFMMMAQMINIFPNVSAYTDKNMEYALNGSIQRERQIIDYIKTALQKTDSIELRHIWLMDYWEFEDRPFVHKKTILIAELTADYIKEIVDAKIWNTPDKMYPNRPSFYCLNIAKR